MIKTRIYGYGTLAVLLALLCVCGSAYGDAKKKSHEQQNISGQEPLEPEASTHTEPYYNDGRHGWYWYEVLREKEEVEEEEVQEPQVFSVISQYTYTDLWNMHPDKFQALLMDAMKYAVQFPTEQNVKDYLLMQDIARRKSAAFASVVAYVGQKNPEFSNADVHPTVTPGRRAIADLKYDEIKQTIQQAAGDYALIMFTRQGCKFCTVQKSILQFFIQSYDWDVKILDIDETPGVATRFGIEQTPSIIIVSRETQDYMPISVGVVSLRDLNERIYRSVRLLRGTTTPQQWFTYDFEKNSGADPLGLMQISNKQELRQ